MEEPRSPITADVNGKTIIDVHQLYEVQQVHHPAITA